MRHLHNRALHGWGIAQGFQVTLDGPTCITISPGFAIDRHGREIVLEEPLQVEVAVKRLADEAGLCFLTVSWEQLPDDFVPAGIDTPLENAMASHTRWREWPGVAVDGAAPADPSLRLMLARLVCGDGDGDGEITAIDGSQRRPVGLHDA